MIYQRICKVCGLKFETENSKKFCCSKKCGYKCVSLNNKKLAEKRKLERNNTPLNACEKCGVTPDEKYASGRFCSVTCARSYSTALNRKEINEKVKKTLISAGRKTLHSFTCKWCKNQSQYSGKERNNKRYCSKSCAAKDINNHPKAKERASERMRLRNERGEFFQSFGHRVRYNDNGLDIHCDSLIEWCFLEDFTKSYNDSILSVSRSKLKIPYELDGKARIYIPDFDVLLKDGTTYVVECKSDQSGSTETWNRYHKEASFKKKLLEEYCFKNNLSMIWFTQNSRKDLYKKAQKLFSRGATN